MLSEQSPKQHHPLHPFKQAKYLVEEKGFFSTKQSLLTISAENGLRQSAFCDPSEVV